MTPEMDSKSDKERSPSRDGPTCNTDGYGISETTQKTGYDKVKEDLWLKNRRELIHLKEHQDKLFYEDNMIISKLELKNISVQEQVRDVYQLEKMQNSSRNLRLHQLKSNKSPLQRRIFDVENVMDRMKEDQKYTQTMMKASRDNTRFNYFKSKPSTCERREKNKKLKETLKMKNVSLTILKNETNKVLSVLEDKQKIYREFVEDSLKVLDYYQVQHRSLR